jgi:hypothetical protein
MRAHRDQAGRAAGEFQHLQRLGELDELRDVIGDGFLRDDQVIDREGPVADQLGVVLEVGGPDPRDASRHVEDLGREVAGDEVGLVALGRGDHHVGVIGAGRAQRRRLRGVAHHRAQVEPVLQLGQALRIGIDDGDVVLFGDEALRHRCADPPGAQNDDLQVVTARPAHPCGTRPSTGRCRAA